MNRLVAIIVALFALACANVACAQYLENFEAPANATGNTSFVSNGVTFDIVSHNAVTFSIDAAYPGTGWNGTAADNKYIDNNSNANASTHPDFSIKTRDGSLFTVGNFWLYLQQISCSTGPGCLGSGGSVTVTGKRSGTTTVFTTPTVSSGFNTDIHTKNGFSQIDLSATAWGSNNTMVIDELEIVTTGNFQYVALDALTWTKLSSYTIGTVVTPTGAGTLTCTPSSVSPGGTSSCTATPNSGYELNTISGCNGTTSGISPYSTGTINANCTVTAAFVTALSAITSKTDVSCNGGTNGSANVTASNGIAPYTYSWSPSGGTGPTASNLAAGTYTVTVTDNHGVQIQKQAIVGQPASPLALSPASISDGLVNWPYAQGFSASGGTSGYTYAVTSGAVPGLSVSGSILSGTPSVANNYNVGVTVTDANGCTNAKAYPMQVRATMGLLSVSDATDFAAYGQPVDYTVSLSNATGFTVSGIAVTASLPSAFGSASWRCLSNGSNGVVCNGGSNSGTLSDTGVTIPAGQTAKWNVHATVAGAPADGTVDVNVTASYATPATDSDTLVIFHGGFE